MFFPNLRIEIMFALSSILGMIFPVVDVNRGDFRAMACYYTVFSF